MYPFWERVIWPVLQTTRAKRIVEIGALRGETTALMLERLGPDTELHVIDPAPEFDPAEHEKKFDLGEAFGDLRRYRKLTQGDAGLSFYRWKV